jgi:hypothetical protein
VGENIVANLTMFNPFDAKESIPAVLDIDLEKPILDKCSNYKMTILRFHCPLYSIHPNYIIKGQEFIVRLFDDANYYVASISFGQIGNNISQFRRAVNGLFTIVWNNFLASHSGVPEKAYPYLIYDPSTQLFSLIYWQGFNRDTWIHIDIQVNPTLYYYIVGILAFELPDGFFSFKTDDKPLTTNDFENKYYISNFYINANIPLVGAPPAQYNAFKITSEFPTDY